MMTEERQREMYIRAGNSVGAWCGAGDSLIAAARILSQNFDPCLDAPVGSKITDNEKIFPSIFLLYGFGIECLLKGLWVKNGHEIVKDGRYMGVPGASDHKLHELADATNFSLTEKERDAFISLSVIITSSGRYPVAKNWRETKIQRRTSGGYGSRSTLNSEDLKYAEQIVIRLFESLGYS